MEGQVSVIVFPETNIIYKGYLVLPEMPINFKVKKQEIDIYFIQLKTYFRKVSNSIG